nr:aminoglycoside 6-adenylyltransferase [Bacillota bacterium]
VAKALARNEMFFVKHMNSVLQQKIKKLLDWYIGISYDFKVNTGLEGRYYRRYLDEHTWSMLLKTYADGERMNTANALLASFELVRHLGMHISKQLGFSYPYQHEKDMLAYCKNIIDTYL